MNKIVIVLIIVSFFSCNSKVDATLNIQIKLLDTISNVHFRKIKVIKSGKTIKEFKEDFPMYIPQSYELKNLSEGSYIVEYPNMFDQIITKKIRIDQSKKYVLEIFADKLNDKNKQTILGKQKINEVVEIKYKSTGCFHFSNDSIKIIREKDSWKIIHNKTKFNVDQKHFNYMIDLENKLRHITNDGCTTSEVFIFNSQSKTDTLVDSSCEFEGFEKLARFVQRNGL